MATPTTGIATEQVRVKFDEVAGLEAVCGLLRDQRMGYLLAGDSTIILDSGDWDRLQRPKVAVLKDYVHRVQPVVPFAELSATTQQTATRHRLMARPTLLENIRARLAKLR